MLERMDPRLRRRIAIVLGVAAWVLFAATVAVGRELPMLELVVSPLIMITLWVLGAGNGSPLARRFREGAASLGAYYGAIVVGLLLSHLFSAGRPSEGWSIALGAAAWASITVAAVMWPSKPVVQRPRRRISWVAFAALLPAVAAMFVVRMDDPGPLIAFVLLVIAAITMCWGILAGHDVPPEPAPAGSPSTAEL